MYNKGTLEQFNEWHDRVKILEGITPEGKVGFVDGVPAPDRQRTTAYSQASKHPTDDIYIWQYGAYPTGETFTSLQVREMGWFPETE